MIQVMRRTVTEEQVLEMLHELAQRYHILGHRYEEAAASRMNEFDALKWLSLCSQLAILKQRRVEEMLSELEVPSSFLEIYGTKQEWGFVEPLENTCDSACELAA